MTPAANPSPSRTAAGVSWCSETIKMAEKSLRVKIIAYSAIKSMANFTAPYSILNPETNSDSPSAKSNGVRFNSATQERHQSPSKGKAQIVLAVSPVEDTLILNSPISRKRPIIKKASLISYEIVWETPRSPPIRAYLLLEAQPARSKG